MKQSAIETVEGIKRAIKTREETLMKEFERVVKGYVGPEGLYPNIIKTPLKAAGDLLAFSPLKALEEVVKGAGKAFENLANIGFAPLRMAIVGGKTAGETAKKAVTVLPAEIAKTPFKIFGMIERAIGEVDKYMSAGAPIPAPKATQ